MPTTTKAYTYRGRTSAGKLVKGRLEAPTDSMVATRLRSMGVAPIAIDEEKEATGLNREVSIPGFQKGVSLKDLAVMARQMSTMVGSGLSLLRTLSILVEQTSSKPLAKVLVEVRDDVQAGGSFSDAMSRHPREFPPLMVNMVRAGETGGFLDGALDTVATNFEKEAKLRDTIRSAMTYPVVVLTMALLAVIGMMLFIVPIFKDMFEGLGGQLPVPTMVLVNISNNMVWIGPLVAAVVIGGVVWWKRNKNKESVRKFFDTWLLRIPVFGPLIGKIAIARFSRNFANMISAGVPILQALKSVGETSGSWVIENALKEVADSVRQGRSIAGPLAQHPVFPAMVVQMIAVGEDSGSLETMLGKVAEFYDAEVEATTSQLTSLIEPLLIALLGVVIGGMIVALYLPIFNITSLIK